MLCHVERAVPGAEITVIRPRPPALFIFTRACAREAGRDPQWYLDAATYLAAQMDEARVEDHVIDDTVRSAGEVAADALRLARWLV